MNTLELVAGGLFLVVAWGHGFLTGVPYGAWRENRDPDPAPASSSSTRVYCPATGPEEDRVELTQIETGDEDGHRVGFYACPRCSKFHKFLLSTPAPVYLSNPPASEVEI